MKFNYMILIMYIIFTCTALVLSGCSNSVQSNKNELIPNAANLMPLVKGAVWNYEDLNYYEEFTYKWEVLNISTSGNTTSATVFQAGSQSEDREFTISINDKNEICFDGICAFRSGIELGATYSISIPTDGIVEISTLKEIIDVPAGKFDAFTYSWYGDEGQWLFSFAESVGIIRVRTIGIDGGIDDDHALTSYHIP